MKFIYKMAAEMSEDVDIEASSSASDEDLERFESMSTPSYWLFASASYDRDYIDDCLYCVWSMEPCRVNQVRIYWELAVD